jgi:hypothetical protein
MTQLTSGKNGMSKQKIVTGKTISHKGITVATTDDKVSLSLGQVENLDLTHGQALKLYDLLGDVVSWDDES